MENKMEKKKKYNRIKSSQWFKCVHYVALCDTTFKSKRPRAQKQDEEEERLFEYFFFFRGDVLCVRCEHLNCPAKTSSTNEEKTLLSHTHTDQANHSHFDSSPKQFFYI